MRSLVLQFTFCICVVVRVTGSESKDTAGCVDTLKNCSELVPQGICNLGNGAKCALTCGLCDIEPVMRLQQHSNKKPHLKKQVRPAHVRTNPKTNVHKARPIVHHNSRPSAHHSKPVAHKTRPHIHAKSRSHSKPVSRPRSSNIKTHVKRPAASRNPNKLTRESPHVETKQNNQRRPSKPRATPALDEPDGKDFHSIGPNQVRVNSDVLLASQLAQTKNNALKVSEKFIQINANSEVVVKGLYQTLKEIEGEETQNTQPSGKFQLANSLDTEGDVFKINFNMIQKSVMSNGGRFGLFLGTAGKVVKDVGKLIEDTGKAVEDVGQLMLDFGGFGKRSKLVMMDTYGIQMKEVSQGTVSDKHNFYKTLDSFAVDFGRSHKFVGEIRQNLGPILLVVEDVVRIGQSGGDIKIAKMKIQQASTGFGKIHSQIKVVGETFQKTVEDFGNVANSFQKSNADVQEVRKPISEESPKIPDPPKVEPPKPVEKKPEPEKPKEPIRTALQCHSGRFVSSEDGNEIGMTCNRTGHDNWEHFELVPVGNKIAFKSYTGKFCSNEENKRPLVCNKERAEPAQLFDKIENADGTVSFKCPNQKYLWESDGSQSMGCTSDKIDDMEKFKLVPF